MSVQPFSRGGIRPGESASYAIWVWSTVAPAKAVSVTAVVQHLAHVSAAFFAVCPSARRNVCKVGDLPIGQADELLARVTTDRSAATGKKITLTATVTGQNAVSFHAVASVKITATPKPSAAVPPVLTLPPPALPGLPAPALPGLPSSGLPGVGAQNPGNLFPTVSPGANPVPAAGQGRSSHHVNAVATSATLPLDPRLIGGQLAGLAVLAGAIAIAIARLSLRTQRPQESKATKD